LSIEYCGNNMHDVQALSKAELERYSRHLVIPEIGCAGQSKLKAAKVLVVGAGGLGSPVILYLAAAGIGTIGIVDFDQVDISNLQRQVLYSTEDVGASKVQVAAKRALALNPQIKVVEHNAELSGKNVGHFFESYDVIVDGSDNFETRYMVNDACVLLNKPNVHGAVHRFEGQASLFLPGKGPCYRCVFKEPPAPGSVLNCAQAGVLGVLPGLVGTIQATECLKLVLSIGTTLIGKLLLIDALTMGFQMISVKRDPHCTVCGVNPTITSLDQIERLASYCEPIMVVDPHELEREIKQGSNIFFIDVRELNEYDYSHLNDATNIPLSSFAERLGELPPAANFVVYCKSGGRSQKAAQLMQQSGILNVRHLEGGLSEWKKQIDASIAIFD
jgi:molybdopterin/thiamine biosynthesis adenylyltransferase/rhodanese-related sulfurtransferase